MQKTHVYTYDNWISSLFSKSYYEFYSLSNADNLVGDI